MDTTVGSPFSSGYHDLCRIFEDDWANGKRPRIEVFLADANDHGVDPLKLFAYLLPYEIDERLHAGERPVPSDYHDRFREMSAITDRVLPREIGKYRVNRLLGKGGFGMVYLAKNDCLDLSVAIKVPLVDEVPQDPAKRRAFVEECLREPRKLAELDHRAIVKVYDAVDEHPIFGCYIVMEYIDGKTLKECTGRAWDFREAASLMATVADAVQHASKKGITHRDIKPANILLDNDGNPHLADFGLALHKMELHGRLGEIAGTKAYMAPEQLRGEVPDLSDDKADVWAIGVILYELLTGNKPFETEVQIRDANLTLPNSLNSVIPDRLWTICLRCLEKDPLKRPRAAELASELHQFDGVSYARAVVLPRRNPFFTGRENTLETVRTMLAENRVAAVVGLGGLGKTQTAIEYAYRNQADYSYILFARAQSETALESGFVEIAREMELSGADDKDRKKAATALRHWLAQHEGWLLILDNADDPGIVREAVPRVPRGHVLLTSRTRDLTALGVHSPISLPPFDAGDSLSFLLSRCDREHASDGERQAAAQLATDLGHLPLALEQAAAYITVKPVSFTDYLKSYRSRRLRLIETHRPAVGDYSDTVATTWSLNFDEVERTSSAAADVLRLSAFLDPTHIPYEILTLGSAFLGDEIKRALPSPGDDPLQIVELLEPLAKYSLIERDPADSTYSMHLLVQAVQRTRMDDAAARSWIERLVRCLLSICPENTDFTNWKAWERLLPHLRRVLQDAEAQLHATADLARLAFETARFLYQHDDLEAAEAFYHQGRKTAEAVHGRASWEAATFISGLAQVYCRRQRPEAVALAEEALSVTKSLVGPNHPAVADSLVILAMSYESAGLLKRSSEVYAQALDLARRTLGDDSPRLSHILINLAGIHCERGRERDARECLLNAISLIEEAWGPNHAALAMPLNNLAALCEDREAEVHYRRALKIRRNAGEPDDLICAGILLNLASLASKQGRKHDSRRWQDDALRVVEIAYGPDHQELGEWLIRIASQLEDDDADHPRALEHLARAKTIFESKYGTVHLQVAYCHDCLASLHIKAERYREAAALIESSLHIREQLQQFGDRLIGGAALDTALAFCVASGDAGRASQYLDRALRVITTEPRIDTSVEAWCRQCEGHVATREKRWKDAIEHFRAALHIWELAPFTDVDVIANCHVELARAYLVLGRRVEAIGAAQVGLSFLGDARPATHQGNVELRRIIRKARNRLS